MARRLPGSDSGMPVSFVVSSSADYQAVEAVGQELLAAARASGLFVIHYPEPGSSTDPRSGSTSTRRASGPTGHLDGSGGTHPVDHAGESDTNRFSRDGRSYKVIAQAAPGFPPDRQRTRAVLPAHRGGELVPLSAVITLSSTVQPNTRSQYQQMNSTTLEGHHDAAQQRGHRDQLSANETRGARPATFRAGYTGASLHPSRRAPRSPILFSLSMILIYLVLAAQFNSFRDPLVVLVSVPLSIFGAVVPIMLGFATLNIYTRWAC